MRNFTQTIVGEFLQGFDGGFPVDGFEGRGHGDRSRSADGALEVKIDE